MISHQNYLIEFNLVDQFFKLVRIVDKTCLLLIFFLNITIKNFYLCLFNSHIFSDFLYCLWLWYNMLTITQHFCSHVKITLKRSSSSKLSLMIYTYLLAMRKIASLLSPYPYRFLLQYPYRLLLQYPYRLLLQYPYRFLLQYP
jgi:hypothetical protein